MYRQVLDGFALKTLTKQPNIPDYHLGVGEAEVLDSLPVLVYEKSKLSDVLVQNMKKYQEKDSEEIQKAIADNELEVNDLNWNLALLGGGLGV